MISFAVHNNGRLVDSLDVSDAYMIGSDEVPLRGEIAFKDGAIRCKKRSAGAAGLVLPWTVAGCGRFMLETSRVQERPNPYLLSVELARGRLLRIMPKLEEWGMLDGDDEMCVKFVQAYNAGRALLVKALQANSDVEAAALGDNALVRAVRLGEQVAVYQALQALNRRKQAGSLPRRMVGCSVRAERPSDALRKRIAAAADFVTLPISWRDVEPTEQNFNWGQLDAWVEPLARQRVPLKGQSLLSFSARNIPDWMYIYEHDFDTLRDMAFEHARRLLTRYGQYIQTWDVISGIHADTCFSFSFEQLIELTRMSAALCKQLAPRSTAVVDIVAPWGEYYARNQRSIPPLLYAELVHQGGVQFDAFALQFRFGRGRGGIDLRDMLQISSILEDFAKFARPIHISAVHVPSAVALTTDPPVREDRANISGGGAWRDGWTEAVQSEWLQLFLTIAASKPFVERISWDTLVDSPNLGVPYTGLLNGDLSAKLAYKQLVKFRSELQGSERQGQESAG